MNMANIHPTTGVAYGYISATALDNDVVDALMYGDGATNESANDAYQEWLRDWRRTNDPHDEDKEPSVIEIQKFWDGYEDYEPTISGEYEGVKYATSWLGGALNFFIFQSPVTTSKARLASLCVPNCGILDTLDGSVFSYDVPTDWRCRD